MKLKFEDAVANTGEAPLLCPECGGRNLHHGVVEVFNREGEDSDKGLHVTVSGRDWEDAHKDYDQDLSLNPSSRRDGVLIHLECEGGCGPFVLQIAQHKGETLMQIGKVKRVIQWGGK